MRLAVIIPAHNEEDNIEGVINKVETSLQMPHELIVVNDHSQDRTAELVLKASRRYPNVRLIENLNDKGFANAVKTGFANNSAEVVVLVMADLCDDLRTVTEMFEKINAGYDVVAGARYIKNGARLGGSKVKGFFSCFVGWSLHYLLGVPTHDIANAFKMYRKSVLESIDIQSKGFEISMEIPLKAYYSGFRLTEVPTIWRERVKGKSSFSMFKLLPSYLKLYIWALFKRVRGLKCRCFR